MLCIVLFVFTLTKGCQGNGDNSSTEEPMLLIPPPVISRRMSSDLVDKLRRQLMRDNYDYQNGNLDDDRKKMSNTQLNPGAKGGPVKLSNMPRTLENTPRSGYAASVRQRGQHDQFEQTGPEDQDEHKQVDEYERLNEQEQQPEAGQQTQYTDNQDAAEPTHTDETDVREVLRPFSPDRRGNKPAKIEAYNPSYDKRRDAFNTLYHPAQKQVAPVRDPRGEDAYEQDKGNAGEAADDGYEGEPGDEQGEQGQSRMESEQQDTPNQDDVPEQQDATYQQDAPDQQETSGQQNPSGQQDDKEVDNQEKKKQEQAMYDKFGAQGLQRPLVTRANRLQYYLPNPRDPDPSPPRRELKISKKDLLYYMDDNQLRRNNVVSADVSDSVDPQVEDGPNQPHPKAIIKPTTRSNSTRRQAATKSPAAHQHRTHAPRSIVVTVSAGNVTYKLLTMKTRQGRRSSARRFLEERAPDSVALISLDNAPLPAFRLPRTRRQYMHEPHEHRSPLGDILPHHHHRHATS